MPNVPLPNLQASIPTFLFRAHSPSYAAIAGLGHGLPTEEGFWLRADPVELFAGQSEVRLKAWPAPTLELSDTKVLVEAINVLLDSQHLALIPATATSWYMRCPSDFGEGWPAP